MNGRGSQARNKRRLQLQELTKDNDESDDEVDDNLFCTPNEMSDLVLMVEGGTRKLHVNKSVLMIASPVFKAMFTHGFKEKGAKTLDLKDKVYSHMVYFLRCIYPNITDPITQENVHVVLPLLDEYQCDCHIHRCEDFLIRYVHEVGVKMKPNQIVTCMLYGDRYNMRKLLEHTAEVASKVNMEQLDVIHGFDQISAEGKYLMYSHRTKALQRFVTAIKSTGKFNSYPAAHEKIEKYDAIKRLFNNADFL